MILKKVRGFVCLIYLLYFKFWKQTTEQCFAFRVVWTAPTFHTKDDVCCYHQTQHTSLTQWHTHSWLLPTSLHHIYECTWCQWSNFFPLIFPSWILISMRNNFVEQMQNGIVKNKLVLISRTVAPKFLLVWKSWS